MENGMLTGGDGLYGSILIARIHFPTYLKLMWHQALSAAFNALKGLLG